MAGRGWQPSGLGGPSPLPPTGSAPDVEQMVPGASNGQRRASVLNVGAINDLIDRLRHFFAVASAPEHVYQVPFNANQATRICAVNPYRIQISYQMPAGVTVYEGPNQGVTTATGYQLPIGGGYAHGPEGTQEIWIVSASAGVATVKELIGDVAYPHP